jgi:hypothetical protein
MGKRILLVAIGLFVSALGFAQRPPNSTRGPVKLTDRFDPPVQSENPVGVYSQLAVPGGIPHGWETGNNFNMGNWVFNVTLDECPDCDVEGVYLISVEYKGITYTERDTQRKIQEEGFGSGVLLPSATVVDFTMAPTNCFDINPHGDYSYDNPVFGISGWYRGGGVGEEPGTKIRIDNGRITGRVSGRDCMNQTIYADINMVK